MGFYNIIFASSYKYYSKYYEPERSRFRAATIVAVHVMGLIAMLGAIVKKIFSIDVSHSIYQGTYKWIIISFFLFCLILIIKYYSNNRAEIIVQKFEDYPKLKRRAWAFITIFSLIFVYVAFLLING
jgi:hypothetical protein